MSPPKPHIPGFKRKDGEQHILLFAKLSSSNLMMVIKNKNTIQIMVSILWQTMGEKPVSKTVSVNSYRFKTPPGAPLHTLDLKSDGRPTKIDHFKGVPPE